MTVYIEVHNTVPHFRPLNEYVSAFAELSGKLSGRVFTDHVILKHPVDGGYILLISLLAPEAIVPAGVYFYMETAGSIRVFSKAISEYHDLAGGVLVNGPTSSQAVMYDSDTSSLNELLNPIEPNRILH